MNEEYNDYYKYLANQDHIMENLTLKKKLQYCNAKSIDIHSFNLEDIDFNTCTKTKFVQYDNIKNYTFSNFCKK